MNLIRTVDCLPLIDLAYQEKKLLCPMCGNDWMHLEGVHVETGISSLCQGERAIARCRIQPAGWGRGPSIRIALYCEEGHSTWLDLVEHKGHIHVERFRQLEDETTRKPLHA